MEVVVHSWILGPRGPAQRAVRLETVHGGLGGPIGLQSHLFERGFDSVGCDLRSMMMIVLGD